jgi:RHS repeat-associated protein
VRLPADVAHRSPPAAYADASGREVNSAEPGGHITTTEYDHVGNTARELTAANRELALSTSGAGLDRLTRLGINGLSTAERAQKLSTTHVYSSDATRELETFGPLHLITLTSTLQGGADGTSLTAGTETPARQHVVTAYDEGRPTDGTATVSDQPTTVITSARVDGFPTDADARTSTTPYDWAKGLPTATTDDPSGLNVSRTTTYDDQGRVAKTTQPASNGFDAGTTVTTYWSATGTGACKGRPEWADLVCSVEPAAGITGGGTNPTQLPTKTTEYDRWGNAAKVTETANGQTRTTTLTYDDAGRAKGTSITGGLGTAVSDTTTTYDPATGTVASVTSNGQTITQSSDMLGRGISYDDGNGNTTATEYDSLDRPVKVTDSAPSTTTFTYDTTKDPRGLPTSRTDSVAGTVDAVYDADGSLVSEKLPGGYTLTLTQDEVGAPTSRVYTRDSDGTAVASDTISRSVHGQIVEGTDSAGQSRTRSYTYDALDRLTRTDDTAPDGTCTRRDYSFDKNTNRKTLATSISAAGEACTSTGATTLGSTYDSADRLIAAGTVYDAFGRTTATGNTTLTYHVNDLVQSETVGDHRTQWSLDAAGRLAQSVAQTQAGDGTWSTDSITTNHYGSSGDAPSWARTSAGAVERSVPDMAGGLGAATSATGDAVLQLTNMHSDVTVQLPLDTAVAPIVQSYDEYGNRLDGTVTTTYGWLGGAQRDSGTLSGVSLMGVRLYDSTSGRFLQIDPVAGGNDNNYEYCRGNPVGCTDVSGAYSYSYAYDLGYFWQSARSLFGWVRHHFWVFPFTGCGSTLSYGERCNLAYGKGPVRVVGMGKTYWEFKSLPGHVEGIGKVIRFSFHKSWGRIRLTVTAHGANDKWFQKHMLSRWGNYGSAWFIWLLFAANIAWYAPRW